MSIDKRLTSFVEEGLRSIEQFPKEIKKEIDYVIELRKSLISRFVSRCESPIEQLLAVRLIEAEEHLYRELSVLCEFKSLHIYAQKEVIANGRKYRLDFLIECVMDSKTYKFAIEADGHEFHEKTKEQAARDKARERNLMKDGHLIIRFTGSEIWRDVSKCVGEIIEIVQKKVGLDDYYQKLLEED